MTKRKAEIITFKVDSTMSEAMRHIPNRSEFIRNALLAALENLCPVCNGTGHLSPKQKEHWSAFTEDHALRECGDCHELHIVCTRGDEDGCGEGVGK